MHWITHELRGLRHRIGVYYLDAGLFTIEAASPRLAVSLPSPLLDLPAVGFRDGGFWRRLSCRVIGREGDAAGAGGPQSIRR